MPWLKKNLMLVLGGLVGLVLLGGSAFFLYSQTSREAAINAQLEEKRNQWTTLHSLNPFPDERNIKVIKEEAERLRALATDLKQSIHPVKVPAVADTFELRLLIETTIAELTQEAEQAGVSTPDNYAFTFQRLREMGGQFDSNGIPKLAEQVSHVATICRILYDAKIHSLDTLRRSPVLKDEGGGADYLTKRSITNRGVIRTPYDLSFRTFSGELGEVIREFAAIDACVAIKTLNIEPTTLPPTGGPRMAPGVMPGSMPSPMMPPPFGGAAPQGGMSPELRARYGMGPAEGGPGGPGGMSPELRSRYGIGAPGSGDSMRSRYGGLGPGMSQTPAPSALAAPVASPGMTMMPPAPRGPSAVLDEKPLRVILQLDFVKPAPEGAAGAGRTARPAAPADGSTEGVDSGASGGDTGDGTSSDGSEPAE